MIKSFIEENEIMVINHERSHILTANDFEKLNNNCILPVNIIEPKAIGSGGPSSIFIAFAATMVQQILVSGSIELLKIQFQNIIKEQSQKYKGYQDPPPYIEFVVEAKDMQLNINVGSVNDSDEVKKQNTDRAFETIEKLFRD